MRPTIFLLFVCTIAPPDEEVPQRTLSEQDISILFPEYLFDDLDSVNQQFNDNGSDDLILTENQGDWQRSQNSFLEPNLKTVNLNKDQKSYVRNVTVLTKQGRKVKMPHKKTRNFVCDKCAKTFKNKFHLERHALTHSNEKPFKCLVGNCPFESNREDNLYVHRSKHLKKKESHSKY